MSKMYDFKQAIRVGRTTFPLGIRQVPAEMEKNPFFQKFLKAGSVIVAGAEQAVGKKLSDLPKLPPPSSDAAKRSQTTAEAVQTVAPEAVIGGSESASPEAEADQKASKKKGK